MSRSPVGNKLYVDFYSKSYIFSGKKGIFFHAKLSVQKSKKINKSLSCDQQKKDVKQKEKIKNKTLLCKGLDAQISVYCDHIGKNKDTSKDK